LYIRLREIMLEQPEQSDFTFHLGMLNSGRVLECIARRFINQ
jgi:hypothetical protein